MQTASTSNYRNKHKIATHPPFLFYPLNLKEYSISLITVKIRFFNDNDVTMMKIAKSSFFNIATIIVMLSLVFIVTNPASASTLTLVLKTDKPVYNAGETVNIQGNLTLDGVPVQDALVALEIDSKNGYYVFRTIQTGAIQGANWLVEIVDLYSCDQYGNPKNASRIDSTGYLNVTWRNNSAFSKNVTTALYLQFSTGSPFLTFVSRGEISANATVYQIDSFPIPSTAPTGTTTIYASLYTDFPKNGGIPFCPEKNATFTITSTFGFESQSSPYRAISTSASSFQTTITLPRKDVVLANYIIYATCQYNSQSASDMALFQAILVGDVDGNKKVDMADIGLVCKAYGSKPGDPKWDSRCDLNGDGKIDMKDVGIVCRNYGNTGV